MSDDERTARTRAFYDTVAATYADALPDAGAEAPLERGLLDHFVAHLPDSTSPVLDAGCGTGRMLGYLSTRGASPLVGVDLSARMLSFARRAHPGAALTTADSRALPYADSSIRAILSWYAIIHSSRDDVTATLREARRVLEPGGSVLLGFQAGIGERTVPRAYGHDVTLHGVLHEPQDIAALLREIGFEVTATVDRFPVGRERHRQGFVLACRA